MTFLTGFLVQNTQNRDTQAIQLKLGELIRVTREGTQPLGRPRGPDRGSTLERGYATLMQVRRAGQQTPPP
jgi:low affinity iron permease